MDFVDIIRKELTPTIEKILRHPYIKAIEDGKIAKDKLTIFVGEQYYVISNDLRNFAVFAGRTRNPETRFLFLDALTVEREAFEKLKHLAEIVGMSASDLMSYEPLAGANAFTNFVSRLALSASDGEMLSATLVDLPVWGSNCGRLGRALKRKYGLQDDDSGFFDLFATPLPEEFVENATQIIDLELPGNIKEIKRVSRLILDYELMFWDTVYEHSTPKSA